MNSKKFVMYNGRKDCIYFCFPAEFLVKGKVYEIIKSKRSGFQINYILKDIDGEFASFWFYEIKNPDCANKKALV